MDEYCETAEKVSKKNLIIETLQKSIKNSLTKYNRTREEASKLGMEIAKSLRIGVHPKLVDQVDAKESYLDDLRQAVSAYKPKNSCLEIGIMKSKDDKQINEFRSALLSQQVSQDQKQQRKAME